MKINKKRKIASFQYIVPVIAFGFLSYCLYTYLPDILANNKHLSSDVVQLSDKPIKSQTVRNQNNNVVKTSDNNLNSTTMKNDKLYVDNDIYLQKTADWISQHPSTAPSINYLLSQPIAKWFGDWDSDVKLATNDYVSSAYAADSLPILVAYNIPDRDCGGFSAGGASNSSAYSKWIYDFASGIGERKAIVVLEPDSIADDCFSSARAQMLRNAVNTLNTLTHASIYLDGGNSNWQPAEVIASRLEQSGIASSSGFSLNVSNFYSTESNTVFGEKVSEMINGKHFVIDTSRNGSDLPSAAGICNPAGASIGKSPTLDTGNHLIDAYLWIKVPGESDGQGSTCNPTGFSTNAPAAGNWWPEYASMLSRGSV